MPAVTVTNTPTRHVVGDLVMRIFNVTGAVGDTIDLSQWGMKEILWAQFMQDASAITISGTTVTITSFVGFTAVPLLVLARVG